MNDPVRPPLFSAKLVFGLAVVAVGLILLADNLRWYDAWHLLSWWPVLPVALGLARLVEDGPLSLRGHIWMAFGAAAFIHQFGPWGLLERWWPALIMWAGLIVTLRALFPPPKRVKPTKPTPPSPTPAVSCDPGTDSEQVKP